MQGQVGALLVAEVHGLVGWQEGLGQVVGQHEEKFVFEDAVDPFGQRVLVAIVAIGCGAAQFGLVQGRLVGIGGVLAAPVGMVNGSRRARPPAPRTARAITSTPAGRVPAGVDVMAQFARTQA